MRLARIVLAFAVAFWMAGAGCMLGCNNMMSAAASEVQSAPAQSFTAEVSGDSCASAGGHHDCCAKRHARPAGHAEAPMGEASESQLITATSSLMTDCPLAINATAALAKSDPDQAGVAVLASSRNLPTTIQPKQVSALSRPLRLPNRGHTYLRCCVFLI
ncbi:MAG TPA: hypothetical protein VLL54_18410 [Pyrinomonadaceae bacterium]|nr:hypothetical protein [Pyrinomonadaceae bacterium]